MAALVAFKEHKNDNFFLINERFQTNELKSHTALADFYSADDLKILNSNGNSSRALVVFINKKLTYTHESQLIFQRVLEEFRQRKDLPLSILDYGNHYGQFWYALPMFDGEF